MGSDSELVKYGKALLGLGIFIAFIVAMEFSGIINWVANTPALESGKVAVGGADAFASILQTILATLFTWAVFVFGKVGEFGIAFWKAFIGMKPATPEPQKAVSVPQSDQPVELSQLIDALTSKARAKRNERVAQADKDAKSEIEAAIREAMEGIDNA